LKLRHLLVLPVVLVLCVVPSASARTAQSQNTVAGSIATELAKAGAQAAIAHFAPDLVKYTDPTAAGLAQIQSQLAALDQKLTELKSYQETVATRLDCVIQRTPLNEILASADEHLRALVDIGRMTDQAQRVKALATLDRDYLLLGTQQGTLHRAIVGDGALVACARLIEKQQEPFLTSQLAPAVRDYYAAYEAAALGILTVRLNLMNNGAATPTLADQVTREVLGWIAQEQSLIKPAFPDTESYYVPDDLLLKTRVASNGLQDFKANDLFKAGWSASIRNGPGCSHLIRILAGTGVPQAQQRREVARRNILQMPRYVYCYDDHDGLYAYDFDLFRYENAAHIHVYVSRDIGTVMAHHAQGFFDVSKYSYLR
jgi:hypothetical protein